jgi:hypothetical protein
MATATGWLARLAGLHGGAVGTVRDWLRPGSIDEAGRLVGALRGELLPVCSIAADSERRFLDFGRTAARLSALSDVLVEKSRQAIEVALGRHGRSSDLVDTVQLLRAALEAEAWNRELTRRLVLEMRSSATRMTEIRSVEPSLTKATAMLRVIGVLFRTESARLPDEVRNLFLDLSSAVGALGDEVRASFGDRFRAVECTEETSVKTAVEIAARDERAQQKASVTRGALDGSLDAMARQIESNQSREVDLMEMSRRLAGEVERIVMGVQSHDIISQKLAHLEGALLQLEEERSGDQSDRLDRLRHFCRVEAGQLAGVERDFRAAIAAIEDSAAGLLKVVEAVDEEDGLLARFTRATSTTSEMVQVLLDGLGEMREVVAASAAAGEESRRAVEPIALALSGLDQAMVHVALRMGRVALNAQVLAVQRGHGTGLEVLAARTAQISAEAESFGARVSGAAREVVERIGRVAAGFAEAERRMGAERATIEEKGTVAEGKLHGLRDEMLGYLRELGSTLDEMREATTHLMSDTAVLTEPLGRLEAARLALERTESAAAGRLVGGRRQVRTEWLAHGYTMASEREVHEAAMAGVAVASPASTATEEGEIELF